MTNMIERMARALAERNIPGAVRDKSSWVERQWPHYVADATAALRELLQPTEGMVGAIVGPYWDGVNNNGYEHAVIDTGDMENMFTAAIQAALEGE